MNAKTFYFIILFGLTACATGIGIITTYSFTNPLFANMCNASNTHGKDDMNNCIFTRNLIGNPIGEFFTIYPILIIFTRSMLIGSKKEFLAKHPNELYSIFHDYAKKDGEENN